MSPPPARVNPFPGLRPFTPEEDYLFFGREEQTLELLQRLAINRFVAVVGTSGSGKSSLVRCGLLSELLGGRMLEAGASWEIAVTHPGGNPLGHLTDALLDAELYDRREEHARENLLATLSRSHFGLVEAVKQADLGDGTNFLIVVDQFEEIFRFHEAGQTQQEAANEFVSLLLEAAAQKEMPIYVVLTMRSDFIGECGQFEGLAEMVNRGEFLIPRLTREQYKRVIEGPIKVAGGQIAPRLLQRLLNDLGQQADQLPCLQHALMRTWDVWTAQGDTDALDLDDYQLVGKMSQALSLHADEIYQSLASDHQRALCQGMFQALTVEESNGRGIRRPQRLGRLCQILEVPADELLPIIDAYRHRGVTFLMPSPEIGLTEQTIIDISHESLMRVWARLRQWVEEETQAAGIYRRLSESAYLHKQGKAGLYRDPELGIALAWREAKRPNAAWADRYRSGFGAAIAFLDASQQASVAEEQSRESARQRELEHARRLAESQQLRLEQQQRSARKLRRLIGGLAVVAVIAGLACVTAMIANQRANTQAENARQNAEKANTSAAQARQSQQEADLARAASEESREAAQAEAYRAVLSEARALRAGHQPGWRDEALADLARLATSPSSKRNLLELRTEAVAALGTPDVRLIARIEPPGGFESFGFSPDGPTLMTAGRGGLDFWNVQELKHVAASEEAAVAQASWTALRKKAFYLPHGQGLAVATPDQGVVFTDLTGKRTARPPITRGAHSPVQLSADSEGRRIAVNWSGGGKLTVHNLESGETLGEFLDSQSALSPDGRWIAHEGPQFEVLLNRIGSKEPEKSLGHHNGKIVNFAFSPDGNTLGSTSWDKTATLWDVAGRKQPVVLRGHRETVNDLAFSPDGGWVATASTDFTARIWDVPTGQSLAMLPGPYFAVRVAWSSDGSFLAVHSSTDNNSVDLYRITGRRIFQRLVMHQHGVQCVAANPRLDRLATGADDHVVIDWDLTTAQPSRRKSGTHPTFVTAVAYSPDGSLLASGAGDGSLVVRDAETGETKARLTGHKVQIRALAFDSSGQRLASGDQSGRVIVWDLSTKQPMQQLYVGPSWVWSIAFLDDGRKLVSEVSNGPVAVFDLQSGKPEAQITLPGGIRRFIADPARKRLIVAFNNGDLCSLSTPDLAPGHRLEHAHPSAIESLTLSPDGRLLATGGADGRVVFRDPVTFEPLLAFPEWTAMVKDLAFTPSARHLAYVGADSDVALWDLTLVQEGLEAAGLAWDRPAPATVPATRPAGATEQLRSAVPVIRRAGTVNPVEYDQARRLVLSGVGAFENGRLSEAVRDLQQARDRLRTLRKAAPGDRQVASQLAISLGFLGSAFKNDHRPADALVSLKEARQVLEAIREPSFMDLYNLACTYSNLTTLAEPGSVSPSTAENEAMAERAMETLQRSLAAGMNDRALMDRDHDLDPLRERPDFRALILQSSGRTREAVPYLAEASAAKPKDTLFSLKVAALQAWFGQDKELAVTRQRILSFAKDTSDAGTAERAAKACSILPSSDKAELEAALGLGRTAVKLSKGEWNLLALGMAEYRSGNYAAANEALLAAAQAGPNNSQIGGISAFFRAMSLFRQGKADEAQTLANAAAAKLKPMPKDENNPLAGDATTEDLILWMAHKEARSLLK